MFGLFNKNKNKKKCNIKYINDVLNLDIVKELRNIPNERIYAIFLKESEVEKHKFEPITHFMYGNGDEHSIFEETFKPNEVPEICHMLDADAIVMIHNHPKINGVISKVNPSKEDVICTINQGEDWQSKGCFVLDHIIVNEEEHYSFLENDLINLCY